MKYLLWILLLFAGAAALTAASHNPAYVLLVYPPYRIELSFTLCIVLLLLAFAFGYILLRLISAATQLPSKVRAFRQERAHSKIRALMDESLNAFFEGRYAAAEKAAARAMEAGETSALCTVIAARSAHELREYERRDTYLSAAEEKSTEGATMRLMAAARFMLDQHDPRAALNILQTLRNHGVHSHPGILMLELKAQQQSGNWDEVLNVLDQLETRKAIDVTAAAQFRQQAWLEKLRQQESLSELSACLKTMPADIKRHSRMTAAAVHALTRHGGCALAQQLLVESLNAQWDSELVALFGDCPQGDEDSRAPTNRIEQAEKWLAQHNDDAGLLLALGKLCLRQKLWGKAQSYLDASLSIAPSQAAYTALAQLAERLEKSEEAFGCYRKAMELASRKEQQGQAAE